MVVKNNNNNRTETSTNSRLITQASWKIGTESISEGHNELIENLADKYMKIISNLSIIYRDCGHYSTDPFCTTDKTRASPATYQCTVGETCDGTAANS